MHQDVSEGDKGLRSVEIYLAYYETTATKPTEAESSEG